MTAFVVQGRKQMNQHNKMVMDELAPKATGRDATIEKRKETGAKVHAAAHQKDSQRDGLEMDESVTMGGGDDFRSRMARKQNYQQRRDVQKQERRQELQVGARLKCVWEFVCLPLLLSLSLSLSLSVCVCLMCVCRVFFFFLSLWISLILHRSSSAGKGKRADEIVCEGHGPPAWAAHLNPTSKRLISGKKSRLQTLVVANWRAPCI